MNETHLRPVASFRLRSQLVHSPDDDTKYMNVHVIHQLLSDKYSPATEITPIEAHKILVEAFPSVQSKRMTKGGVKSTFLLGVSMATSTPSTSFASSQADQERQQLAQRITQLEEEVEQQKLEIESLKRSQHLVDQAEKAMSLAPKSSKGPDSHKRLPDFSVAAVIRELNECSPDLCQLFQLLGDTARSSTKHGQFNLSVEEMKAIMSLCTVLNARSNRFKGMQLLLSFMLIARGTSKQVCLKADRHNIHTCSTFYAHTFIHTKSP